MFKSEHGLSLIQILILVAVFGLLIGGGFLLLNNEKAKTRDAKRLSDITRIQAAFEFLYNQTASYTAAAQDGCDQAGMLASQCNLSAYIPAIRQFRDPGKYQYVVTTVPGDDAYAVTFQLEKEYYNLTAGQHVLTQDGIQ